MERQTAGLTPALSLLQSVMPRSQLNLSEPQFPHLSPPEDGEEGLWPQADLCLFAEPLGRAGPRDTSAGDSGEHCGLLCSILLSTHIARGPRPACPRCHPADRRRGTRVTLRTQSWHWTPGVLLRPQGFPLSGLFSSFSSLLASQGTDSARGPMWTLIF